MLKFILLLVLFLLVFSTVRRLLFWLVLGKKINNFQNNQPQRNNQRQEGDVWIKSDPNGKNGKRNNNEGQFVDFEEVK